MKAVYLRLTPFEITRCKHLSIKNRMTYGQYIGHIIMSTNRRRPITTYADPPSNSESWSVYIPDDAHDRLAALTGGDTAMSTVFRALLLMYWRREAKHDQVPD